MTASMLRRNTNAERQGRHRAKRRDAGMQAVRVWLDADTVATLRAIAKRRRMTFSEAAAWAINDAGAVCAALK